MKLEHNRLNSNSSVKVTWTKPLFARFKEAFQEAQTRNADTFVFENNGYTVGYAYHLIHALKGELSC